MLLSILIILANYYCFNYILFYQKKRALSAQCYTHTFNNPLMQQLIYFIKKFRYFLLFLLLEIMALVFIINHHSYHKSKFVHSANNISGSIYNKSNSITTYFNLKATNNLLAEENTRLKNLLAKKEFSKNLDFLIMIDSSTYFQKYTYTVAKIINNNYTQRNNVLTLNKGKKHGLTTDLGVVNSRGVVGVIGNVSANFATVQSILNSYSKINIRLKNSHHFGTLIWDGENYSTVQITDIPRQANITVGDTVVTGGKSTIFPEGIGIGAVKDFHFKNKQYQQINIALFNDMSEISHVQVIKNLLGNEQKNLENEE